jgi:MFS family permease
VLLAGFVLAGVGIGCAETAESTMVALALPDRLRGNGYGVLGLVQSLGDLGASVVAGLIWALVSPTAAFGYAAAWMLAALVTATAMNGHSAPETDVAQDQR